MLPQFRSRELVLRAAEAIKKEAEGLDHVKIMNFCGTHEWTITHFGLRSLMPENIELVAGPGCPVCITPGFYVEIAVKFAMEGFRIFTYGDMYKLPSWTARDLPNSLEEAKSVGADVRIVYSIQDALSQADEKSIFLAPGFETTAPATAAAVGRGMLFIVAHRLTPPVMRYVLDTHPGSPIKGVIAPGHVSTIIGAKAWSFVVDEYEVPTVISGFEPLDVMLSILEILRQIKSGEPRLHNEYRRVVTWDGNERAQLAIKKTFEVVDSSWRGIGTIPRSGLRLKEEFSSSDALRVYGIEEPSFTSGDLPPGCKCAEITLGMAKPTDCPLFMRRCTPSRPYGPCMVSSEGTCNVWARHGSGGLAQELAKELGI